MKHDWKKHAKPSDSEAEGKNLVRRRHVEWLEHQVRWRWLLDSFEGGERYRNAVYGPDRRGLPCRNLIRHRREYPDPQQFPTVYQGYSGGMGMIDAGAQDMGYGPFPGMLGSDAAATAQDDDYELRRSRTPVPEFVAEAVEIHLAKLYDQEVRRDGPLDLVDWWKDVDGRGTPIDDWMRDSVAPLLLVLGCLDVCFDHPQIPEGETVVTRLDEMRLGLDKCVASFILPQNMLWQRLDQAGRYTECLVREYVDPSERIDHGARGESIDSDQDNQVAASWRGQYVRYRYWNDKESILYNYDGDEILKRTPHGFGRVPIVRLVDQPKHRMPHVGKSRYEGVAELQREYYNRDSELILSDTLQAHPFLSGAEDFCKADNTLAVGPGYILPKKKCPDTGAYEGWEFVSPSKDPAESIRKNKQDILEAKDRRACLTKPAGSANGTVGQSGISKQLDAATGHKLLASIAKSLAKSERFLAEYALLVLRSKHQVSTPWRINQVEREEIRVVYPARFELQGADDLTRTTMALQQIIAAAGQAPSVERELIQAITRQALLGLSDAEYAALDHEVERMMAQKALIQEPARRLPNPGISDQSEAMQGPGSQEADAGEDPTGVSDSTQVANMVPTIP